MKNPHLHNKSNHEQSDWLTDSAELDSFIAENRSRSWLTVTVPVHETDPLAYVEQIVDGGDLYYWEQPEKQFSIASGGSCEILKATGSERFAQISHMSRKLSAGTASFSSLKHSLAKPLLMGGYSFTDHNIRKEWQQFGAARFVLTDWCLVKSGKLHLLTLTVDPGKKGVDDIKNELDYRYKQFLATSGRIRHQQINREPKDPDRNRVYPDNDAFTAWSKQVENARFLIKEGAFKKIVIAREQTIRSESPIHFTRALYHLRKHFPGCYIFMTRTGRGPAFIGATPERLVSLQHNRILTEGLAGSVPRGESASDDVALETVLRESKKEQLEHNYVVREICDNLTPYSSMIDYPNRPNVKKLQNVQHLFTPISAQSNGRVDIHDLAGALHPTPAVGGYPRSRAVPYINEIETIDRGWYAGPVGWCSLKGEGEFAVAIRSALVYEKHAKLFAGCGIVEDSDPEVEWMETEIKLKPLMNALNRASD